MPMRILGSDDIGAKVIEMVKGAKDCVCMASAWMTGGAVEEIVRNIPDGVKVDVVIRASEFTDLKITDDKVFALFRQKGARIFLNDRLHAKFIVVDNREAVVGSANITMSGYSMFEQGNIEAAVYYTRKDDEKQIEELVAYFKRILETSYPLNDTLVGYVINPAGTRNFRMILLDRNVGEGSFVQVPLESGEEVIGRVDYISSYSVNFFNNPFEDNGGEVYAPAQDFKDIFSHKRDVDWMRAAVYSYLNERAQKVRIGSVTVIGTLRDGRLDIPKYPVDVGQPVYLSDRVEELLTAKGVRIGRVYGMDIPVHLDHGAILSRHMMILGNTGSGKSYFTKLFINRLADNLEDISGVFILDPHGEYAQAFSPDGEFSISGVEKIELEDAFYFISVGQAIEFLKGNGVAIPKGGTSKHKELIKILKEWFHRPFPGLDGRLKELIEDEISHEAIDSIKAIYGKEVFDRGVEVIGMLRNLDRLGGVVVFDMRKMTSPEFRVHIAGSIMRRIFLRAKSVPDFRALMVLEEAHNFAPEKGYGEASAGKDNPALTYARKIASEGRKFGVGLITITQRPAQVSKYVLAQMNTQVMFRTVNAQDLDAIKEYVEYAGEDVLRLLPSLSTGVGLMTGVGIPFPVIVQVE